MGDDRERDRIFDRPKFKTYNNFHLSTAKLGATELWWAAELESFDYTIWYRSGQSNRNADHLSRQHPPNEKPNHAEWQALSKVALELM